MKTEAEVGVTPLQAEESRGPPATPRAGGGKEEFHPEFQREHDLGDVLSLDFLI